MTEKDHDVDQCDCARCIRHRVWAVFLRVEEELRAELRAELAEKARYESEAVSR